MLKTATALLFGLMLAGCAGTGARPGDNETGLADHLQRRLQAASATDAANSLTRSIGHARRQAGKRTHFIPPAGTPLPFLEAQSPFERTAAGDFRALGSYLRELAQPWQGTDRAAPICRTTTAGNRLNDREGTPWTLAVAERRLDAIEQTLACAFAALTPAERDLVRNNLEPLLNRTTSGRDLTDPAVHGPAITDIIGRAHLPALLEVAEALLAMAGRAWPPELAAIRAGGTLGNASKQAEALATGHLLYAGGAAEQRSLIGGEEDNIYTGPARLIIDTGGDDIYALAPFKGLRVIVDLAGDDIYKGRTPGALGGAVLGASLLIDLEGNDQYRGGMVSQGAAFLGVGILIDENGADMYEGTELVQGSSLAGVGLLVDHDGPDHYTAAKFAQGYGGAQGLGLLLERNGDDRYTAGDKHPSSYGVAGRYQAFAQGVGMGFRGSVPGGSGLLADRRGDDSYRGGNYSQGVGYYLGVGRLLDDDGDDRYAGDRYSQGAAAHLGSGLLRDARGDDRYRGRSAANQGAAWDLAVGALVDRAGNDRYSAGDLALGAAAQNAIGIFMDQSGNDRYRARGDAFGHAGAADYRPEDARLGNIAIFSDTPCSPAGAIGTPGNRDGCLIVGTGHTGPEQP